MFYVPMLPYFGGIQRVSDNLATELKKRGYNVCFLCVNSREKSVKYDFPVPQYYLDESLSKQDYICSYQQLLRNKCIDVIINQDTRQDLLELLPYTPEGIKIITCIHSQPFFSQGNTRHLMKYYEKTGLKAQLFRSFCWMFPLYHDCISLRRDRTMFDRVLAESNLICLESEAFIPRMKRYMPYIDASRFVAVSNPNSFHSIELETVNKDKIFLWVGRQENVSKNFPSFVDFWVRFNKIHPEWEAWVVGVGSYLEYNKSYARRKKAKNLVFLEKVDDISRYYEKATFYALTSAYEGQPMTLLEAMSNGCIPCVYDTFESLHDIVDDGVNGVIVPAYDYNRMISRIEDIMQDKTVMYSMQNSAIEKTKKFSVERIVNKWETILSGLGHESE